MTSTVDIPQPIKDCLKKFRFAKRDAGSAALVIKVNKSLLIIEVVEEFDKISIEDLVEELPSSAPRFILLSYEYYHKDGRRSFPLVLVNWIPSGAETGLAALHASAFSDFQTEAGVNKVLEARNDEEFTKDAVDGLISRFSS